MTNDELVAFYADKDGHAVMTIHLSLELYDRIRESANEHYRPVKTHIGLTLDEAFPKPERIPLNPWNTEKDDQVEPQKRKTRKKGS